MPRDDSPSPNVSRMGDTISPPTLPSNASVDVHMSEAQVRPTNDAVVLEPSGENQSEQASLDTLDVPNSGHLDAAEMMDDIVADVWVPDKIIERIRRYTTRVLVDEATYPLSKLPLDQTEWDDRGRLCIRGQVVKLVVVGYVARLGNERTVRSWTDHYLDVSIAREVDRQALADLLQHLNPGQDTIECFHAQKRTATGRQMRIVYDAYDTIHPEPTDRKRVRSLDYLEIYDAVYVASGINLDGAQGVSFKMRAVHLLAQAPESLDDEESCEGGDIVVEG